MVTPSGEVETLTASWSSSSATGSGWLLRPGKLKLHRGLCRQRQPAKGSGWLLRPGKLKLDADAAVANGKPVVPDGYSVRGS